ncbi:MAG TPA: nucleotide pyrophosphohydrolase [Saprospiraceae bacterium]|nr:nucleotide pyrophosphohydrolase [Saprospiraceae bacterium]
MMTFNQWQKEVDGWIRDVGVRYFDVKTNTILLMEECGEFARYIARVHGEQSFKKTRSDEEAKMEIQSEMADIFFVLTCLANQMDISIEDILKENIKKKTWRDKDRHQANKKLK